jgi:hypothetical protein
MELCGVCMCVGVQISTCQVVRGPVRRHSQHHPMQLPLTVCCCCTANNQLMLPCIDYSLVSFCRSRSALPCHTVDS